MDKCPTYENNGYIDARRKKRKKEDKCPRK
jgi:hypothetical protein